MREIQRYASYIIYRHEIINFEQKFCFCFYLLQYNIIKCFK